MQTMIAANEETTELLLFRLSADTGAEARRAVEWFGEAIKTGRVCFCPSCEMPAFGGVCWACLEMPEVRKNTTTREDIGEFLGTLDSSYQRERSRTAISLMLIERMFDLCVVAHECAEIVHFGGIAEALEALDSTSDQALKTF